MSLKPAQSRRKEYVAHFHRAQQGTASRWHGLASPDPILLLVLFSLVLIGLTMITSSSMHLAVSKGRDPLYYTSRHLAYCITGFMAGYAAYSCPVYYYERYGKHLLWLSIVLLLLLQVPGLGITGGGATRWLWLGFFTLQVSEVVKLGILLYCARALFNMQYEIKTQSVFSALSIVLVVCALPLALLLLQPDYGSTVLIIIMVFWLFVLADLDKKTIAGIFLLAGALLALLIVVEPYRLKRFNSMLNPWDDPFGDGYQLINSLIAVGNGGFFGRGIGESIQKYAYLPEAHNDFIFAIIAEEFGFIGASVVLILFLMLLWRCFVMAKRAFSVRRVFVAYYAYGVGLLMTSQAIIHIYVNVGLAPTKGITLPLVSFGGSSTIMSFIMLAILLRMDSEVRMQAKRENKL